MSLFGSGLRGKKTGRNLLRSKFCDIRFADECPFPMETTRCTPDDPSSYRSWKIIKGNTSLTYRIRVTQGSDEGYELIFAVHGLDEDKANLEKNTPSEDWPVIVTMEYISGCCFGLNSEREEYITALNTFLDTFVLPEYARAKAEEDLRKATIEEQNHTVIQKALDSLKWS